MKYAVVELDPGNEFVNVFDRWDRAEEAFIRAVKDNGRHLVVDHYDYSVMIYRDPELDEMDQVYEWTAKLSGADYWRCPVDDREELLNEVRGG